MTRDNVIRIVFHEDLSLGRSRRMGILLNRLRFNMEMAQWRERARAARPTDDPSTWDWDAIERLDRSYEMVGLP